VTEITCEDCGAAHQAKRRTAKVCPPCRLIRNAVWAGKKFRRVRKCRACGQQFRAIHDRDYDHCGTCTQSHQTTPSGTCGVCKVDRPLLAGTRVCVECFKDPDKHQKILRLLRKSQKERKAANA
jgi:hypothetical protein